MSQLQKTDSPPQMLRDYLAEKYVGVHYLKNGRTVDGLDCYGLLCVVYSDVFDITLDAMNGVVSQKSHNEIALTDWVQTDDPITGDAILFELGRKRHVGIYYDNNLMLHSVDNLDTCIERYDNYRWKNKIVGFYRHKHRIPPLTI